MLPSSVASNGRPTSERRFANALVVPGATGTVGVVVADGVAGRPGMVGSAATPGIVGTEGRPAAAVVPEGVSGTAGGLKAERPGNCIVV